MLQRSWVVFLAAVFFLSISGCANMPKFNGYPKVIGPGEKTAPENAIVLIGITGQRPVTYVQFTHASFPAINLHFESAPKGDQIIAIPMPVGISRLSPTTITVKGRPGMYLPGGMSLGYIGLKLATIDITKPGLYYFGTINTDNTSNSSLAPIPSQLEKFRLEYKDSLDQREPVNFQWPDSQ